MKALLIIDVQKSAVTDKKIASAIEKLQYQYENVYISQFINQDSPIIKLTGWKGYDNEELAFAPAPHAVLFQKKLYSSYIEQLKNFDEIHICGFDTDACIYKTALDLIEQGIRPIILSKYCGSGKPEYHKMALTLLARNIGSENII